MSLQNRITLGRLSACYCAQEQILTNSHPVQMKTWKYMFTTLSSMPDIQDDRVLQCNTVIMI